MVQDGYPLSTSLTAAFGLVNGWLIAYAEVPSLFTRSASGLFLARLGQAALFKLDVVRWSPGLDGFERHDRAIGGSRRSACNSGIPVRRPMAPSPAR